MKIVNECRVEFNCIPSSQGIMVNKTVFSNSVFTQILNDTLEIKMFVDKIETYIYDILTYMVVIRNISCSAINHLFFKDRLSERLEFVQGSVLINGMNKDGLNIKEGFPLGSLDGQDDIKIAFKVLVLKQDECCYIKNFSEVSYDYTYNIEKSPARISKYSNLVRVPYVTRIFKDMALDNVVKIYNDIDYIKDIKYKVNVIKCKLVRIAKNNLCTLLVIGKIEYIVFYESGCERKCEYDVFGFSETVSVPLGIYYSKIEEINIKVEDIAFKLINKNTIYINTNLLIYY